MTRIAGIVHPAATTLAAMMVPRLSAGAPVQPSSARIVRASDHCALIATSHRDSPSVYDDDDVSVVLNGSIFNASELGSARDDAALVAECFRRRGFADSLTRFNGDFSIALFDKRQ